MRQDRPHSSCACAKLTDIGIFVGVKEGNEKRDVSAEMFLVMLMLQQYSSNKYSVEMNK